MVVNRRAPAASDRKRQPAAAVAVRGLHRAIDSGPAVGPPGGARGADRHPPRGRWRARWRSSSPQGAVGLPKFPLSPGHVRRACSACCGATASACPRWATAGLNWTMHRLLRVGIALVGLRLTLGGADRHRRDRAAGGAHLSVRRARWRASRIARLLARAAPPGIAAGDRHGRVRLHGGGGDVAGDPRPPRGDRVRGHLRGALRLRGHAAVSVGGRRTSSPPRRCTPGVFLGTAIHDTSQVMGAALIYSQQAAAPDALAAASVAKLLRNLSIAVLMPAGGLATRSATRARRRGGAGGERRRAPRPHVSCRSSCWRSSASSCCAPPGMRCSTAAPGRRSSTPATRARTCSSPAA